MPEASSIVRWFFEDRASRRIVVVQAPNLTLWVFLAAVIVQTVVRPGGGLAVALRTVRLAAIFVWAADEIVRGVNPWRRILGGLVLGATAASLAAP